MKTRVAMGVVVLSAFPALGQLTLLPAGPQIGTHVGNLVSGGSFEAGPPGALVYWATGTTGTPFFVPPGWTSSGPAINYAQWGHTATGPYRIANSAPIVDGAKALYFGNAQGGFVTSAPTFNPSGEVTFAGPVTVGTTVGAPVVLSQTVNTHLAPAPSYVLSFWVSGEGAQSGGAFDGLFGLRVTNTAAGDPIRYFAVPAGGASVYGDQRRYEFSFTPLNPSLPVTLEFINWGHFNLGPWGMGGTTELVLDDVIVNPVPGPGGVGMVGCVGALCLRRRRK